MPPSSHQSITPTNHLRFDPWTTSSTGHQVADSAQGTAYRTLRQEKLARQFGEGRGDCTVARGAGGKLERGMWVEGASGSGSARSGQRDIRGMFGVGKASSSSSSSSSASVSKGLSSKEEMKDGLEESSSIITSTNDYNNTNDTNDNTSAIHLQNHTTTAAAAAAAATPSTIPSTLQPQPQPQHPQIFTTLTIYINAASHPCVSDHKLKHLLTLHGATVFLSLSRRVTHVIVGRPNTRPSSKGAGTGAGGGLAGGKLQREIARGGCRGWKVVFVEWVLESIKAGKRLSEARFAMQMAEKGQRSVLGFGR
ncbi:hypothetical protein P170DRAFT_511705 [Aspergillus steynii IBT 23096]|uniref:BRCT domain-containing protein n=1 Tax=Aspergillus steynii IBT 23096 TaxID=1392250 RepID=A0A2I2G2D4_9EURO|nr:uncharacterized protein P170DRAFT_511705 [Aspergillus steynii IBT 23096]PLB47053.1 hypothetical protein P170DRAFT_511705 [Aspergillus steynii IBT 23096]